jgi:hypothetical protein
LLTTCAGEDIWDAAQSVIEDINYNPVLSAFSPYFGMDNIFGLAINPVSRRGEHQVSLRRRGESSCWSLG